MAIKTSTTLGLQSCSLILLFCLAGYSALASAAPYSSTRTAGTYECGDGARIRLQMHWSTHELVPPPHDVDDELPELQFTDKTTKNEWVKLDDTRGESSSRDSPIFTKFYRPEDQFTKFSAYLHHPYWNSAETMQKSFLKKQGAPAEKFTGLLRSFYEWDLFVDPGRFTRQQFQVIRECVTVNLSNINKELAPKPPEYYRSKKSIFPKQIASIVYRAYDYPDGLCFSPPNPIRFTCKDKDFYIQLKPPNKVLMFGVKNKAGNFDLCANIGYITDNQEEIYVELPSPMKTWGRPYAERMGENWFDYYGTCKNEQGTSLYEYFTPHRLAPSAERSP